MATARELSREEWKRYRGPTAHRAEPLELTTEEQQARGQVVGTRPRCRDPTEEPLCCAAGGIVRLAGACRLVCA